MSEVNVNIENFEDVVINNSKPVLVDFWAPWCGPCMMLSPHIEAIAEEFNEKITVAKINVDHNEELASKYQVTSIPTLLFFQNGEVIGKSVGYKTKIDLIDYFNLNTL